MSTPAVANASEVSKKKTPVLDEQQNPSALASNDAGRREKRAAAPTDAGYFEEREAKRRRKNHGRSEAFRSQKESRQQNSTVDLAREPTMEQSPAKTARRERKEEKKRRRKEARLQAHQQGLDGNSNVLGDVALSKSVGRDTFREQPKKNAGRKQIPETLEDGPMDGELSLPTTQAVKPSREAKTSWKLSPVTAGRLLDHDPIFVHDDSGSGYLIAASHHEVQVLSLDTSLVAHSFSPLMGQNILSFTSAGNLVFVACDDRSLWSWDWTAGDSGKRMGRTPANVRAMTVAPFSSGEGPLSFYYACSDGNEGSAIWCGKPLHKTDFQISSIQMAGNGDYMVARGPNVLLMGTKRHSNDPSPNYSWIEIPLPTRSTSMDVWVTGDPRVGKTSEARIGLRLAIGNENGKILLFDDVSNLFHGNRQNQLPPARLLHWHREAVAALKFSSDGNYLISGGAETVLVLWQLDTGNKQFLPHLTSQIEGIVVNPEGDRYAVQMGDNSIMVLNTSELKPVANFAGLQMADHEFPSQLAESAPAAVMHPEHSQFLIHAVPSSRTQTARPFLQTYDIRGSRHVSRQALTRNNATDFNLGPEGTSITSPDVKHVAISADGLWLATIDEWTPSDVDLESFASGKADLDEQRLIRREIYMKIWRWDQTKALWTLTTRFDAPHARAHDTDQGAGVVLRLISSPASNAFSTIGEDGCVKLWKPRARVRQGVVVKDDADNKVIEWHCAKTCQLEESEDRADSPLQGLEVPRLPNASLAYSVDGTMLAAAYSTSNIPGTPIVHFIDTAGAEAITKTGLAASRIFAIGFLDRHFIAVAHSAVYVWDLVEDVLVSKFEFNPNSGSTETIGLTLVVNTDSSTFAIVRNLDVNRSELQIHSPFDSHPMYTQTFEKRIATFLAGRGTRSYTLLFADSTIRTLSPRTATRSPTLQRAPRHKRSSKSAGKLTLQEADISGKEAAEDDRMIDIMGSSNAALGHVRASVIAEDDRPVVRPEQLAEIFDLGSVTMPPVKDMFRAITGLYGRKPLSKPSLEVGA